MLKKSWGVKQWQQWYNNNDNDNDNDKDYNSKTEGFSGKWWNKDGYLSFWHKILKKTEQILFVKTQHAAPFHKCLKCNFRHECPLSDNSVLDAIQVISVRFQTLRAGYIHRCPILDTDVRYYTVMTNFRLLCPISNAVVLFLTLILANSALFGQ